MLTSRVLIVGLGSIGLRHLRLARKLLPSADIRVLRHQDGNPIPEHANGIFSSIEQALSFAPEVAVIATPAPFHLDVAMSLAECGAHILIEKPLSSSTEGVSSLLDICRARKLVLLVGYNLRYSPSLRRFRRLLSENLIGRLFSLRSEIGQYLPDWRPGSDYRQSVSARDELGGGVLLELSHEIDYLRWIFGEIKWIKATLSRQSDLEIDVEDTAHIILEFSPQENGHRLIGTLTLDFIRRDTTRSCVAIGENGSLRWNGITNTVEILEQGSSVWREIGRYPQGRDDTYRAEWLHFLACVQNRTDPLVSGEDGFKVLEIIEAARRASEFGSREGVSQNQLTSGANF